MSLRSGIRAGRYFEPFPVSSESIRFRVAVVHPFRGLRLRIVNADTTNPPIEDHQADTGPTVEVHVETGLLIAILCVRDGITKVQISLQRT